MKRLTVIYDDSCGFCTKAAVWLREQTAAVALDLIPRSSPRVQQRFPGLSRLGDELVAVGDDGAVYRETKAWLICLWALPAYRPWSFRLSTPTLMPLARQAFQLLSTNRHALSSLLGLESDTALRERLEVEALACQPATGAAG